MKISIIGSCVTRDAFEIGPPIVPTHYVARSSLGSMYGDTPAFEFPTDLVTSPFQRRMLEWDIQKTSRLIPLNDDTDALIYDPIDERFSLALWPDGGVCTISNEFRAMNVALPEGVKIVPSMTDDHYQMWERGWTQMVTELTRANILDRLIVHRAIWATGFDDAAGESPVYPRPVIDRANQYLGRLSSHG